MRTASDWRERPRTAPPQVDRGWQGDRKGPCVHLPARIAMQNVIDRRQSVIAESDVRSRQHLSASPAGHHESEGLHEGVLRPASQVERRRVSSTDL